MLSHYFFLHFIHGDVFRRVGLHIGDDCGGFLGEGGTRAVSRLQILLICRVVVGGRVFQVVHVIAGDT